jgi:hypothetical protein
MVALIQRLDLLDLAGRAPALKLRGEPVIEQGVGQGRGDDLRARSAE